MDIPYPTVDQLATPEYILAVLREQRRQGYEYEPEPDSSECLSFDSTVANWWDDWELFTWRELAQAQNQIWGIKVPISEWKHVLLPARKKHLRDVCELIAPHVRRPSIRPSHLLGGRCGSAGVFLTIRSLLHNAGADAERIAPSTLLAPYARRYYKLFLSEISLLAPGVLPLARIRNPVAYNVTLWLIFAGVLGMAISGMGGLPLLTIISAAMSLLGWLASSILSRVMLPRSVELGELRTFRDLAVAVAAGATFVDDNGP